MNNPKDCQTCLTCGNHTYCHYILWFGWMCKGCLNHCRQDDNQQ